MTRKDYVLIAACIREAVADAQRHETGDERMARDITSRLIVELKLDNPRFDADRFIEACHFPELPAWERYNWPTV